MANQTYQQVLEGPAPEGRLSDAISRLIKILASPEMARWRPRMVIALVVTFFAKVLAVYAPVAFGEGVNAIVALSTSNDSTAQTVGFLSMAFGTAGLMFLAYGALRLASTAVPQLRDAMFSPVSQDAQRITAVNGFAHVQSLSLAYHQTKRTGAVNRIIDRGAGAVDFLLRFLVFNILPALTEMALAAYVAFTLYGWEFSIIIVVAVLAYGVLTSIMTEWRVKLRRKMNEADTEVNARAVDALTNFETVKSFAAEERETAHFNDAKSSYAGAAAHAQQSLAALNIAQATIMNLGLLAVVLIGGYKALNGQLQVGDIAAMTLMLMQVYQPLNILGWAYREIKQASVDLERLFQTMDLKPEIADQPAAQALAIKGGGIRFDAVSFAHEGRTRSVDEVSLDIEPGSFVGLAGPSGSGKSTLLKLLFRFYDPSKGSIFIDGQDIRDVTQASLREKLGLVPQDVVLFNTTLRDNVLYGRPDADEAALWDALDRAQLKEFVEQLPDQLDTRVGERGLKLSGGEKQRVGVARAILKDPPILILDEATSALDSETEREVQAALNEAARGRTTIAVAHRLSTIAEADKILVMEEGRLSETGTHTQLLNLGGRYAAMWERQGDQHAAA
jgi:ATP-binding cassette subfamily B protein